MGSYMIFSPSPILPCKLRPITPTFFSQWKHSQPRRFLPEKSLVRALAGRLEASWTQLDGIPDDDGCGGWSVRRVDAPNIDGFLRFGLAEIGTSVATIFLVAVAYCSYSRRCFKLKLSTPSSIFHDFLAPEISKRTVKVTESDAPSILEIPVESTEDKPASGEKNRIVIPVPADTVQLEALYVLKKLKIIDYDADGDDLCTKREYARWLVKANSILERKAKSRIFPISLNPSSVFAAFDDVNIDDPDFWCIQALGEAGIVSSRLSSSNFSSLSDIADSKNPERFCFFPDNFISRFDLLNWRALLEYPIFPGSEEKISRTKLRFLDLCSSKLNASPQLLMDLILGDGSIVRRTFGNIRRLQPEKPITKAQAAVALTSGRMTEAIHTELSRLEVEELSRLAEMEEIRIELIRRGLTKDWEEKLNKERKNALQVARYFESVLFDLEMEKTSKEETLFHYMKERADIECQQQMVFTFKKDVDEMCEKLELERAVFTAEKQKVESQSKDLHEKRDAIFEVKSVLEAQKGAIQILRSWVEEEAWKNREKAKVLEHAARRWRAEGGTAMAEQ